MGKGVTMAAVLLVVGGVVGVGEARAQSAPDVVGRWEARWGVGVRRTRDGTETVDRQEDATLVLEAEGDSLVGTWSFELPGTGRATWRVHGRTEGGRVTLVATNGEMERPPPASEGRIIRLEWTGSVEGGRIEGVHTLVLGLPGGSERSSPRPWSAVRPGPDPRR